MNLSREFLLAESDPVDDDLLFLLVPRFVTSLITPEGRQFHDRIQAELTRINSNLTPADIVYRAESQTCYGCHSSAFIVAPGPPSVALGEHVTDTVREPGEAGLRFAISERMKHTFIPHRMEILRRFLITGDFPVYVGINSAHADGSIGGGRVVH